MPKENENLMLGNLLSDFITENRLEKGLDKVRVEDAWNKVMGPAIEKYTAQIKLDRDTLFVRISSSVLRQELSYGNQKIISLLNEELGKGLIKKLVLR